MDRGDAGAVFALVYGLMLSPWMVARMSEAEMRVYIRELMQERAR